MMLGLAGLMLPVLPGVILLFVGFIILSRDIPFLARWEDSFKNRHPKVEHFIESVKKIFPGLLD